MAGRSSEDGWETEAENWVRWARTPGHDAYWYYAPSFFDEIVPSPGAQTLDLGCGEGRTSRDLKARGHRVVGIDSSPTLLRYAREADPISRYELADAARLPFPDAGFEIAVAYNALMDVSDLGGAVREAARVLKPGGHLCISVTHPINDAGAFNSDAEDAPFVIPGSYVESRRFHEHFERDGLAVTFHGWTHSVADYFDALQRSGFVVDRLREPAATTDAIRSDPRYNRWRRVPMFLQLRAIRL